MIKFRRIAAMLATTVALTGVAVAGQPSAASALASDCPDRHFCAWEHSPFTGHWANFKLGTGNLGRSINGYVFDRKFTDVWNRTGSAWCIYDYINYDGRAKVIPAGYKGYLFEWNDRTRSLRQVPVGGTPC